MCSVENVQRSNVLQNNPLVSLPNGRCRINQLPPEILSIIFKHGVENRNSPKPEDLVEEEQDSCDDETPSSASSDLSEEEPDSCNDETSSSASSDLSECLPFAFLVSRICKLWRNVALEMPSLWTAIRVFNTECHPYERVVAYLERSKSLPLDICLDHLSREALWSPSVENDNLKALLTLLVPHLSRWASIQFGVTCYDHMYTFLKAVSDPSVPPATRLQDLELFYSSDVLGPQASLSEFPHLTLFGGFAPLLKIVVLMGVHIDWSQDWLRSAPNLRKLCLSCHHMNVRPSWDTFSAILRGAPALETFDVSYSGPRDYPGEPLLLPNLSELNLTTSPPQEVISLLGKLSTPALKTLTLDFGSELSDYSGLVTRLAGPATQAMLLPVEQPCSLLRSLETLRIKDLQCDDESAEILYRELVNLKVFDLPRCRVPWTFFELLYPRWLTASGDFDSFPPRHPQSRFVTFLPSLKDLFISGAYSCDIVRLAVLRRDAGVPLRAIFMTPRHPMEPSDMAWLRNNLEKFEIIDDPNNEVLEGEDVP